MSDTSHESFITCPHCGCVERDSCDYPSGLRGDGDRVESDCSDCGKPYSVTVHIDYSYSTRAGS